MTEQMLSNLVMQVDHEINVLMSTVGIAHTLRDMKSQQAALEELMLTRANILAMVTEAPVIRPVQVLKAGPKVDESK